MKCNDFERVYLIIHYIGEPEAVKSIFNGYEHAVTLQLPPFWTTQPTSWFTQAEAQLIIRGIVSDDTKYYYILASLDLHTAARLLHLLENHLQKANIKLSRQDS